MNSKRILIFLITLLCIVIFAESIYLFIGKPVQNKKNDDPKAVNSINSNQIQPPISCEPEANYENCKTILPSPNPNQAINESQLSNLRVLRKGLVKTSTLNYQMEGIIDNLVYSEENELPKVIMRVKGIGDQNSTFTYSSSPLLNIKTAEGKEIGLIDLKEKDKIRIDIIFDMLKEQYLHVDITIL